MENVHRQQEKNQYNLQINYHNIWKMNSPLSTPIYGDSYHQLFVAIIVLALFIVSMVCGMLFASIIYHVDPEPRQPEILQNDKQTNYLLTNFGKMDDYTDLEDEEKSVRKYPQKETVEKEEVLKETKVKWFEYCFVPSWFLIVASVIAFVFVVTVMHANYVYRVEPRQPEMLFCFKNDQTGLESPSKTHCVKADMIGNSWCDFCFANKMICNGC